MAKKSTGTGKAKGEASSSLVKFVYSYDRDDSPDEGPPRPTERHLPTTASSAVEELFNNNAKFASFIAACHGHASPKAQNGQHEVEIRLTPREVGLEADPATNFPKQKPFAAFLGCVDARAPVEILFAQGFDDIYTFRVAGNTLGPECTASLHYALHKLAAVKGTPPEVIDDKSLRLVASLGHADCGAVTAAVDTILGKNDLSKNESEFLVDDTVRALLGRIHFPAINLAAKALPLGSFGTTDLDARLHRSALIELSVYVNAAWSGREMQEIVSKYQFARGKEVGVRYGVFDPRDCFVRSAEGYHFNHSDHHLIQPRKPEEALSSPPDSLSGLNKLAKKLAAEIMRLHRSEGGKEALGKFLQCV